MTSSVYVFDTNVLVAAFRSRLGASHEILRRLIEGELPGLVSNTLMTEYEAVLTREVILAASWASAEDVGAVLDVLAARLTEVRPRFRWRPALPDPADDMVLECAVAGGASAIVTLNIADFPAPALARFGLGTRRPGELLRQLVPFPPRAT
jgi:putative PIN family toxin of toxin-antitoxin system